MGVTSVALRRPTDNRLFCGVCELTLSCVKEALPDVVVLSVYLACAMTRSVISHWSVPGIPDTDRQSA
jgi:hypothetical protein